MSGKVAVVTGASSGIGEATAVALRQAGFEVYGAARRLERLRPLEEHGIHAVALDVTDPASRETAVRRVLEEAGRVDVLVNNAGYGSYGAIEDVPLEEARRQFEVNVFGATELTRLLLPQMRERGAGTIVNVTFMGGKIYTPLGGWYHATKFALEALSDCLRLELESFGIDVVVIEPGGIATEWSGIAADHLEESSKGSPYFAQAAAVASSFRSEAMGKRSSPPSVIADAIVSAVTAARPKTRYAVGFGAKPLLAARAALPDRAFDALVRRAISGTAGR